MFMGHYPTLESRESPRSSTVFFNRTTIHDFSGLPASHVNFFYHPMWVSNEVERNTVLFFHGKIPSEWEMPSNWETPREIPKKCYANNYRRKHIPPKGERRKIIDSKVPFKGDVLVYQEGMLKRLHADATEHETLILLKFGWEAYHHCLWGVFPGWYIPPKNANVLVGVYHLPKGTTNFKVVLDFQGWKNPKNKGNVPSRKQKIWWELEDDPFASLFLSSWPLFFFWMSQEARIKG